MVYFFPPPHRNKMVQTNGPKNSPNNSPIVQGSNGPVYILSYAGKHEPFKLATLNYYNTTFVIIIIIIVNITICYQIVL